MAPALAHQKLTDPPAHQTTPGVHLMEPQVVSQTSLPWAAASATQATGNPTVQAINPIAPSAAALPFHQRPASQSW
jgi:hypothetical protein